MPYKSPYPDVAVPNINLWELVFNNPTVSSKNSVPDNKVVIIDPIKKRDFTFGQLRQLSQSFGQNLHLQLRWKTGDCLAIFAPNCPEYIISVLGGVACGATISPASAGFSMEELTYQLQDSGAKALITHSTLLEIALKASDASGIPRTNIFVIGDGPIPESIRSFDVLTSIRGSTRFKAPDINIRKDLAALPYSSGTTGRPKGVRLTHYNLVCNALQCSAAMANGQIEAPPSDEIFISVLPFSHIYGLMVLIIVAVMTGRTQIILPKFDLVTYLELVQKYTCNAGYIVPPILTAFAKHPIIAKYDLSSLRKGGLMCAAAPLSVPLIDAVYDRLKIPVYQAFGMTEASPATHILTVENWKEGKGSVGALVPGVEARLVDEDGKDVKPGDSGEVWVRGKNIFAGYHNNDAATADCMTSDGYYKTGDIARVDPNTGYFYITDRVKELIKYKGFQVPPAELESVLSGHEQIADVAVIGVWNEAAQTEEPRAYIVLQAGLAESKELGTAIAKWLEQRVAHYKRLRGGVHFVQEIPKNPSGKILRRVLKQQALSETRSTSSRL